MLILFYRKVYENGHILHEYGFDWLFEHWIQSGVLAGWNPHVENLNKSACLFYMLSICSCFFSAYYSVLFSSFQFSVCHSYSIPTKSTGRSHLIKKHSKSQANPTSPHTHVFDFAFEQFYATITSVNTHSHRIGKEQTSVQSFLLSNMNLICIHRLRKTFYTCIQSNHLMMPLY